jgi:hypothetical protein
MHITSGRRYRKTVAPGGIVIQRFFLYRINITGNYTPVVKGVQNPVPILSHMADSTFTRRNQAPVRAQFTAYLPAIFNTPEHGFLHIHLLI